MVVEAPAIGMHPVRLRSRMPVARRGVLAANLPRIGQSQIKQARSLELRHLSGDAERLPR